MSNIDVLIIKRHPTGETRIHKKPPTVKQHGKRQEGEEVKTLQPFRMGDYWYIVKNGKRIQCESYSAAWEMMNDQ